MKPHEIIAPWKGDKRFTAIAKRAAALKKAGQTVDAIKSMVTAEFGAPTVLLGLRAEPAPAQVFGTEGVETPAQHAFLQTSGCDLFQGYLFSEPLPPTLFEHLMRGGAVPSPLWRM